MPTAKPTTTNNNDAYYAALRLVNRLDPQPLVNRPIKVRGRWYDTLDEAVRAILAERVTQ